MRWAADPDRGALFRQIPLKVRLIPEPKITGATVRRLTITPEQLQRLLDVSDFPVETNGQALVEAIRMIPGHKHLVFEEGLQSAWLYETLRPHVDKIVVAGVSQSRGQKSDKRGAYGLAEKLRTGALDKTRHPSS